MGTAKGDPVVTVENLVKRFGDVTAVEDASFDVHDGEFFSLLGPSGCGKTTTLRLIAGFERPSEGEVRIQGDIVNEKPPYKRDVGLVFQGYALFPHKTVMENVGFGLKMRNVPKSERQERVEEALELVDLPGFGDRMPGNLSGGQQQRVALARALVIEPSVLLLDEPLSDLDLKLRKRMRFELQRIQKEVGITTIYVTHDQEEALSMSDRVCVMNHGQIEQIDSPDTLYNEPKNRFVADFIGESNLLDGRVTAVTDDELRLKINRMDYEAHVDQSVLRRSDIEAGDEVSLNLRPENISISNGVNYENSLSGTVRTMEFLGKSKKYLVDVDGNEFVIDEMGGGSGGYSTGEQVTIGWSSTDCGIVTGD